MIVDSSYPTSNTKIEKALLKNFKENYWKDRTMFTAKKNHGKNDKNDEIAQEIKKAKEVFEKNKSQMQKIGTDAGLLKGVTHYTITWVNKDTGEKADSYKVNI